MAHRHSTTVVLLMLGLVSQPDLHSTHFLNDWIISTDGDTGQSSNRAQPGGKASIVGARVSGSVVSASGRPVGGLTVRMFRRVGGFGSESSVAVVGASGTFEIPNVPPGRYRLSVATRSRESTDGGGEFAYKLIEVQDRDLDDLVLVLGPGASISGRVVVEAGASVLSARYYAAHLLGDLRDPRAVPILVPLLQDKDVNYIVPWALGQIGDRRAIGPLLDALDDASASVRVLAINALETLRAREALPRLTSLLNDHRRSNFGAQVSVADAAKAAIAKLQ